MFLCMQIKQSAIGCCHLTNGKNVLVLLTSGYLKI